MTVNMALGIAVGYSGLEKPSGPVVLFLIFAVGVLVAALRRKELDAKAGA